MVLGEFRCPFKPIPHARISPDIMSCPSHVVPFCSVDLGRASTEMKKTGKHTRDHKVNLLLAPVTRRVIAIYLWEPKLIYALRTRTIIGYMALVLNAAVYTPYAI